MQSNQKSVKKTKYFCNEKLFKTDTKNIPIKNLCVKKKQHKDQVLFKNLENCVSYCSEYLHTISVKDDELLINGLSKYSKYKYILNSLQSEDLLKHINREGSEVFVHIPFISIFEVFPLFQRKQYQNNNLFIYENYLEYNIIFKELEDICDISQISEGIFNFIDLIRFKPNENKNFTIVLPINIIGLNFDIFYTNQKNPDDDLSFDVNTFINSKFPSDNSDNLKLQILKYIEKDKQNFEYKYKYGHAILMEINLKYTYENGFKTSLTFYDNEGIKNDNNSIHNTISDQVITSLNELYTEAFGWDIEISEISFKFHTRETIYTKLPMGFQTDYMYDVNEKNFDAGYCDALVSLLIFLLIANQNTHSLEDISKDIQQITKINSKLVCGWKYDFANNTYHFTEGKNESLRFNRYLYPQYHTGLFGLLLLNTFMVNLYYKYFYKTFNKHKINLSVNQLNNITSDAKIDNYKSSFKKTIQYLINRYKNNNLKKTFKNLNREIKYTNNYENGIYIIRDMFMEDLYFQLMKNKPNIELNYDGI